jgi:hypothetical protein
VTVTLAVGAVDCDDALVVVRLWAVAVNRDGKAIRRRAITKSQRDVERAALSRAQLPNSRRIGTKA